MLLIITRDGVLLGHNTGKTFSYRKIVFFNMGKQTFLHKLEYAPNIQALLQTNTDEKFNLDHTAPRLAYKTQEAHSFILNPFHLNTADSQDVKVFFPPSDYISQPHMHAQTLCRKIHMRAYFILGLAGINVKI